MAPKGNWKSRSVGGPSDNKSESKETDFEKGFKLGDSVVIRGSHGGARQLERSQYPYLDDKQWENLVKSASKAPQGEPAKFSKPESAPVKILEPGEAEVAPNGATERQVQEGGTPGTYGTLDAIESVTTPIQKFVENPILNTVGAALEPILNPTGSTKPIDAENPPASKVTRDESGSASVSMSMPGEGPAAPAWDGPSAAEVKRLGEERGAAEVAAIQAKAFAEEQKAIAKGEERVAILEYAQTEANIAADTLEKARVEREELQKLEDNFIALKAEQAKIDPTIDPNRYWKNKDAGQIAMGAIAGALFGFAGKGIEYLAQIQREVETDIDAQKATFEQSDKKTQRQIALAGDEYARAKARGLSDREARASANISKLASMKAYIDAAVGNTASVELRNNAVALRGGIDAAMAKAAQDASQAGMERASRAGADWAQKQSARAALINADTTRFKAAAGGKSARSAALQSKIANTKEVINTVKEMVRLSGGTFADKAGRTLLGVDPGFTQAGRDKKADDRVYEQFKEVLARAVAASALQKDEAERILGSMPSRNSPFQDQKAFFDTHLGVLNKKLADLESGSGDATEGEVEE